MSGRESPFKGLESFADSDHDARLFFGREREREIIVANLLASKLTVLYGETGVGKSSVLRAGVARDLRALPEPLAVVVFDEWKDDPARTVQERVAAAAGAEPQSRLVDTLELGAAMVGGEVVVILDGFEEEFLYHGLDAGPDSFFEQFSEAVTRPGLRASFLVAVREDALAKLDRFKSRVPNVFGNYLRLPHLDRDAAREAILGPLDRYNETGETTIEVEPALVEAVLDQVAAGKVELGQAGRGGVDADGSQAGIEAPYLQLVMQRLWEAETQCGSNTLRLETFERLGGAEQIVRDHLDRALDALEPEQRDVAAAAFNHLVTPSGAKIAHDASDLAGYVGVPVADVAPVLSSLAAQRILRSVPGLRGSDQPRYEIYHDILADAVLAWRTRHESDREVGRVREAAAKRHRRLLLVAAAAVLLAGAMAVLAIYAKAQGSEADKRKREAQELALRANEQARHARASELVAKASLELPQNPRHARLLAEEAARKVPSVEAQDALRRGLLADREEMRFPARGAVRIVRYSPSRPLRILAAGDDGVARVYDPRKRKPLYELRFGEPIVAAEFGKGGKTVVAAGEHGRVVVWSLATGKPIARFYHGPHLSTLDVDPTSNRLVTAGGKSVKVWRVGRSRRLWSQPLDFQATRAIFSRRGGLVAVIGNSPLARVYDGATGRLIRQFDQGDFVTAVAFSPNGLYLATGGRNHMARVWNLATGEGGPWLKGHKQDIVDVEFSSNGHTLATASLDGSARKWNASTGALTGIFSGQTSVTAVRFSPDRNYLLTTSNDGTVLLWKNTDTPDVLDVFTGHGAPVTDAAFSPDSKHVLTAGADGTARLWDARQPKLEVRAHRPGPLLGAAYVGGDEAVVGGPGNTVSILRLSDGDVLQSWAFPGKVTAFSAKKDGSRIAVAYGGNVELVHRGSNERERPIHGQSAITSVALSANGKKIATAGTDHRGRIWTSTGTRMQVLKGHSRALTDIAFNKAGTLVATSSKDGTVRIWDARSGHRLQTLPKQGGFVVSVAFSPDGRFLLTTGTDRTARLWNVSTGKPGLVLRWHGGTVRDGHFSRDGRWIVTIGSIAAQLWQRGVKQPLFKFGIDGYPGTLASAVFDRSSRTILAASGDGTVRTYHCTLCGGLQDLLREARKRRDQSR